MYAFDPELAPWMSTLPDLDFADYEAVRAAESRYGPSRQYEPPAPIVTRDLAVAGPEGPQMFLCASTRLREVEVPCLECFTSTGGPVALSRSIQSSSGSRLRPALSSYRSSTDSRRRIPSLLDWTTTTRH